VEPAAAAACNETLPLVEPLRTSLPFVPLFAPPVITPLDVTAPAFHTPLVIVPTVAMSEPTSLEAAIEPARSAFRIAPVKESFP
jgi:hypothetical protein